LKFGPRLHGIYGGQALRAKHRDVDVSKNFNTLTGDVKKFRSVVRSGEVMKFVLSEHYGKPYN
jgi:hypothetical protein